MIRRILDLIAPEPPPALADAEYSPHGPGPLATGCLAALAVIAALIAVALAWGAGP